MLSVDRSQGAEGSLPQPNGQQHSRPPDLAPSPSLNRPPLQGDRMDDVNPGLKPWAESSNRFAVNSTGSWAQIWSALRASRAKPPSVPQSLHPGLRRSGTDRPTCCASRLKSETTFRSAKPPPWVPAVRDGPPYRLRFAVNSSLESTARTTITAIETTTGPSL
jgi:hypothetical protein